MVNTEKSSQPILMPQPAPKRTPSPQETAAYSSDILESLHKMARQQGQDLLAHLLALAAFEAKALARPRAKSLGRADAA